MKRNLFGILLILFLGSFATDIIGQDTTKTIITYSRVGSKRERPSAEQSKKHLLKVDPFAVLVGEIPFFYETRIIPKISVELLAGITHSDYLYELTNLLYIYETGDRSPLFGYTFGTALKFYPSDYTYALEGPYFGLEARVKRFNTNLRNTCSSTNTSSNFLEKRNVIDGKIIGGYIWHPGDNFVVEAYGGIGIRSLNIDGYVCDNSGPLNVFGKREINTQRLALSLGVRLGVAF